MTTLKIRAKLRQDTSALWGAANPVLLAGEPGYESDTKKLRIGDGVTAFTSLPFIVLSAASYQVVTALLTSFLTLGTAANKSFYATSPGVLAEFDLSAFARTILDDTTDVAVRATLGLIIGTNVQAYHAKLAAVAAMTWAAGDVFYATGTNTIAKLSAGTALWLLRQKADLSGPEWSAPPVATTLLGTITTTSGASQTLSSLNLTTYKFLRLVFDGVSVNTAANLTIGGSIVGTLGSSGDNLRGIMDIDLTDGTFACSLADTPPLGGGIAVTYAGDNTITTASVSVVAAVSAGTFDAGEIRVFGML